MRDGILVDESVFDDNYIPERMECRESEIRQLAMCLQPTKVGKFSKNVYIHGPPGVGKTSVVKWLLGEHFDESSVYVNCWSKRTTHKIIEEILKQRGLIVLGNESASELVSKFENLKTRPIVCLDECDQMKDLDILYILARCSSGIILISNHPYVLSQADRRIESSLFLEEIEFKPYSHEEILYILKKRVSFGLNTNTITHQTLSVISKLSGGDARIALQTLRHAARDAETKGHESITMDHVKTAVKCARRFRLSYLLGKINDCQRTILDVLKKRKSMPSGKLFEELTKNYNKPILDRTYRNHMKRLKELGLVRERGTRRWKEYEIVI